MMLDKNKRVVQLKTSVLLEGKENSIARKEPAHINFLAMQDINPKARGYGVQNEMHKTALDNYLVYMKSIEDRFFSWLESDAKNAILFANDPLKAVKEAVPDFDATILNGLDKSVFE